MFFALLILLLVVIGAVLYFKSAASVDSTYVSGDTVVLQAFDQLNVALRSWPQLEAELPRLSPYFSAVWLPPVSNSTGGVGYIPRDLFDFNSAWGTESELKSLLAALNRSGVAPIVDCVFEHRQGHYPKWFEFHNPTFLSKTATADGYVETLKNDQPKDGALRFNDPSQPSFIPGATKDDPWLMNDAWRKRMYGIATTVNYNLEVIGGPVDEAPLLTSINLFNVEVLKAYIQYLHKLKKMGVRGTRFDESDAIAAQFTALFTNNDAAHTAQIVRAIIQSSKLAEVNQGVSYTLEQELAATPLAQLTPPSFEYVLFENYTSQMWTSNGWRGLQNMLINVNGFFAGKDIAGSYDFALQAVLRQVFASDDIAGSVFTKPNMLIGDDRWKPITYTFVNSHDNQALLKNFNETYGTRRGDPSIGVREKGQLPAYFVVALLPGIPIILKFHWDLYGDFGIIKDALQYRRAADIRRDSKFEILRAENGIIRWRVYGRKATLTCAVLTAPPDDEFLSYKKNVPGTNWYLVIDQDGAPVVTTTASSEQLFQRRQLAVAASWPTKNPTLRPAP